MTANVQLLAIVVSVLLMVLVLELVRRRVLSEEFSFIWIVGAAVLIVASAWRDSLHLLAAALGIHYPPAVLLLLLTLFVFVGLLYFSAVASTQRRHIERLMVEAALQEERLRVLEDERVPLE